MFWTKYSSDFQTNWNIKIYCKYMKVLHKYLTIVYSLFLWESKYQLFILYPFIFFFLLILILFQINPIYVNNSIYLFIFETTLSSCQSYFIIPRETYHPTHQHHHHFHFSSSSSNIFALGYTFAFICFFYKM